jgi:hypothetical protein
MLASASARCVPLLLRGRGAAVPACSSAARLAPSASAAPSSQLHRRGGPRHDTTRWTATAAMAALASGLVRPRAGPHCAQPRAARVRRAASFRDAAADNYAAPATQGPRDDELSKATGDGSAQDAPSASPWLPDGRLACPTLRAGPLAGNDGNNNGGGDKAPSFFVNAESPHAFPWHDTCAPEAPWWDLGAQLVAWRLAPRRFEVRRAEALQAAPLHLRASGGGGRRADAPEVRLALRAPPGGRLPPGGLLMLQPYCTHASFGAEWPWAWHEDPVPCLRPTEPLSSASSANDGATTGVLSFDALAVADAAHDADRFWNRDQYTSLQYDKNDNANGRGRGCDPNEGVYRVFLLYAPAPRATAAVRRLQRALGVRGGDEREPLVALEVARLEAHRSILQFPMRPHDDGAEEGEGDPFAPFHDGLEAPL